MEKIQRKLNIKREVISLFIRQKEILFIFKIWMKCGY